MSPAEGNLLGGRAKMPIVIVAAFSKAMRGVRSMWRWLKQVWREQRHVRRPLAKRRDRRLCLESLERRQMLTVNINGTAGDDHIAVVGTESGYYVVVNNVTTSYTWQADGAAHIDGGAGHDSIAVSNIAGYVTLRPLSGSIGGLLTIENCETQTVFATRERLPNAELPVSAVLYGSAANDQAYDLGRQAIMLGQVDGTGYFNQVLHADNISFDGEAGHDLAVFVDSSPLRLEMATARLTQWSYHETGFLPMFGSHEMTNMESTVAFAQPLLSRSVRLTATDPGDVLVSTDGYVTLYNAANSLTVVNFASVDVDGSLDATALIYDSPVRDFFNPSPTYAAYTTGNSGARLQLNHFGRQYCINIWDDTDHVVLNGFNIPNYTLYVQPEYTSLLTSDGALLQTQGFSDVTADVFYSQPVIINDSTRVDRIITTSNTVNVEYGTGAIVRIVGTARIFANSTAGGPDYRLIDRVYQGDLKFAGTWV